MNINDDIIDNNLHLAILLSINSKAEEDAKKAQKEKTEKLKKAVKIIKIKEYPHIPKKYNIQKYLLMHNYSRECEINIIDQILEYNKDFKIFIFNSFYASFTEIDLNISRVFSNSIFYSPSGFHGNCVSLTRYSCKSQIFTDFINKYLKFKDIEVSLGLYILLRKQLYYSMKSMTRYFFKILGSKNIWDLIYVYLGFWDRHNI